MNTLIHKLLKKGRKDLVKKIQALAGNYYNFVKVGNTNVVATFPSRSSSSGASLIIVEDGNKYHIIGLKRNKDIRMAAVHLALLKNRGNVSKAVILLVDEIENKKLLKYYKDLSPKNAANHLILKESFDPTYLGKYFPDLVKYIKDDDEISDTVHKIGKFKVRYESKLKDSEIKNIVDFILTGSKIIKNAGLEKTLYGKVLIVDKLTGKRVADYSVNDDYIRIARSAKKNRNMLGSFIHELGHRLLEKGYVDTSDLQKDFTEKVIKPKSKMVIDRGDVFQSKKGEKYTIIQPKYSGRRMMYIFEIDGKEGQYKASEDYFTVLKKLEGKDMDKGDSLNWIPTAYSTKNHEEWFCELLKYALTENNKEYWNYIKNVLK